MQLNIITDNIHIFSVARGVLLAVSMIIMFLLQIKPIIQKVTIRAIRKRTECHQDWLKKLPVARLTAMAVEKIKAMVKEKATETESIKLLLLQLKTDESRFYFLMLRGRSLSTQ